MSNWNQEFDTLAQWVSSRGRPPRLSSLDPDELALARWLDEQLSADRAGRLRPEHYRQLEGLPGAVPAGHRRTAAEWSALIEGFRLDRGHLPSEAASDQLERSLGRYLDTVIRPAIRRGRPAADFAPLTLMVAVPGTVSRRRTTASLHPAPLANSAETETARLQLVRDYVSEHGYLPALREPLGAWMAYRRRAGDCSLVGAVDEITRLRAAYPPFGARGYVQWTRTAAAHVREHGALPWWTLTSSHERRHLEVLARVAEGAGVPAALASDAQTVLGATPATDPYRIKWEAVFADFTAWTKENGSLPRRRSTDTEEYRLANWLNVQRVNQRNGRMRPDLHRMLCAVPGALTAGRCPQGCRSAAEPVLAAA